MKFLILTTSLLASLTSAATVCGSVGSSTCGGTLLCCKDIASGTCCNFGQAVSSVQFTLPANSRGQGFSGTSCSGSFSQVTTTSPSVICGQWVAARGRWLAGLSLRDLEHDDAETQDCAEPDVMILADGTSVSLLD